MQNAAWACRAYLTLHTMNLQSIPKYYQAELLRVATPWANTTADLVHGGFFDCLTTDGLVFDTDKNIISQAQTTWAWAHLNQTTEAQPAWLALAQHGADFLMKHAFDKKNNCLAATDRLGNLLAEATDATPAAFVSMALGKVYKISADATMAEVAKKTLITALKTREKRLKKCQDDLLGEQKLKNIGELTSLLEATLENEKLLGKDFRTLALALINEAMTHFYDKRGDMMLVNVFPEGGFAECHAGREVNSGLIFRTCSSLIEATQKTQKSKPTGQLCQLVQYIADATWDKIHGGFYQCLDLKGHPVVRADWSQKTGQTHFEALSVLVRCQKYQPNSDLTELIEKVTQYTSKHFMSQDAEGDWSETLTRQGDRIDSYWISAAKNPYHKIRNLVACIQMAQ